MPNYLVRLNEVQPEVRSGGRRSYPLLLPRATGNRGFAMGYHELAPGGEGGPPHSHEEGVQEAFFFLKGEGVLHIGEEAHQVVPHTAAWVPSGVPHKIMNTGTESLCFLWMFTPPKPEQC